MVKFSVVIITRQINDYIREAMPYLQAQTFQDFEIVLVSETKEKEKFPKTRIINSGRASPALARNVGAKKSKGEIIAFIDDDAYPEKDWLKNALKEFEDKKVVGVGGPSFVPHKATFFQKVSNEVYRLSSSKTGIRYGRAKRQEVKDWVTCNFFVRKKDFLEIGGFDATKWGGEDTQVCYELTKNGKKIIYNPEIIVYHHPRKNLKAHLRQTMFWAMWRAFLMKRYPKDSVRITFLAPSALVLWLFFGGILSLFWQKFGYFYVVIFSSYVLFLVILGFRTKSIKLFFPVIFVTMLTQMVYGIGFVWGLFIRGEPTKNTFNPAKAKKSHINKA